MTERPPFSAWLLAQETATNPRALDRIALAKSRVVNILERETVAHQKTLEQKISDQGPQNKRADPHLLGLAIKDLLALRRITSYQHPATSSDPWYANRRTSAHLVAAKLEILGPLYAEVSIGAFKNLVGDALEVIVFRCLDTVFHSNAKHHYAGQFYLDEPKRNGRYRKTQPPRSLSGKSTTKEADFLQFGYGEGALCIECKNYREWIYPNHDAIKNLALKAHTLGLIPLLIARRIHYTTRQNLLRPAGILFHESLFQYYPSDHAALAERVKDKRLLGFSDVLATEEPHRTTINYFTTTLPGLVPAAAESWARHSGVLAAHASGEISLQEVYRAIKSPEVSL